MPRQRSKKLAASRKTVQDPMPPTHHEDDQSASDNEDLEILERDAEEEELDKLVLGDGSAFMAQLGGGIDVDSEGDSDVAEGLEDDNDGEGGLEGVDDADLFFLDSGPSAVDPSALIPGSDDGHEGGGAAWEDSDDERLAVSLAGNSRLRKLRVNEGEDIVSGREYTKRLRRQFERLNPVPEWALPSARPAKRRRRSSAASDSSISSNEMDVDDSDLSTLPLARLLQDAGSLTRTPVSSTKQPKLRPEVLDIQRSRDIPSQPSSISSLSFHPEYPVLLSSGPASTLYLHHIAPNAHPTPHPLLTSVHVRHTPIHTSSFLYPQGDKIFFAGRRKYFHVWDLPSGNIQKVTRVYGQKEEQKSMERFKLSPCGRYMALVGSSRKGGGTVNILDASSTQWIATARIEGKNGVADFAWWSDGEGLTIVGKGGEVGEWSVESRSYIARWIDDGYGPTVLTLGGKHGPSSLGGDRWVVIGSQSGIVNIYDRKTFTTPKGELTIPERPEPKRSFDQFTKPISNLEISPDGQLLAFSTKWKPDGLRLAHLPSCTVYKNWPTGNTPLGRITAVAFGRASDILAVGNEGGNVRLFDIRA
ncbi:putative U3 small nucleolar RNA-associated protein 18 [Lachnellula cervina]|uniref:Putative U3 small nucleolar RNA-associated protein 18 n=1 Tax=Lachnellula cervina TaxID=1316786 RepID=A0A7D8YTG4_9HELO|nr:putative U3 small nucleolar RNA-associated protein 18 [Lachnellula cervina]